MESAGIYSLARMLAGRKCAPVVKGGCSSRTYIVGEVELKVEKLDEGRIPRCRGKLQI